MLQVLIIAVVLAVCYGLPKIANDAFEEKHGEGFLSYPLSTALAIGLFFLAVKHGQDYDTIHILALVETIIAAVLMICYGVSVITKYHLSIIDGLKVIACLLLSSVGIVVTIVIVLAAISNTSKKTKRRR